LQIFGGLSPIELEDRVRGSIELLQFYGLSQIQTATLTNGAAAEAVPVSVTLSADRWTILYCAQGRIAKTATMTALRGDVVLNRRTLNSPTLFAEELGPFGATDNGVVTFGGMLPYPVICPPGTTVSALATVIGTDATANVAVVAEFGVM
jgi:hypothetical protein